MHTRLPEAVRTKMQAWRNGMADMPLEYVEFHKVLAARALANLVADLGLTVHRTYMADDGWMDGMRTLHVIAEQPGGGLVKLHWHDGNQEFFVKLSSGSGRFLPATKKAS